MNDLSVEESQRLLKYVDGMLGTILQDKQQQPDDVEGKAQCTRVMRPSHV